MEDSFGGPRADRGTAALTRSVSQSPIESMSLEASTPQGHGRHVDPQSSGDFAIGPPLGGLDEDASALADPARRIPVGDYRAESRPLLIRQSHTGCTSHGSASAPVN